MQYAVRRFPFLLVVLAFTFFPLSSYARTLTPDQVRDYVVKHGVNKPIAVLEKNGLELYGKILSIGQDQFVMQVMYAPDATEVKYVDVQDIRTGYSSWTPGEKTFLWVSIGAMAGLTIWGIVHFVNSSNDMKNQYNQDCARAFGGVCPNPAASQGGGGLQFHFGH